MNKQSSTFGKKVIAFVTSFAFVASVAGVSVALAAITFNNTSIVGDSSFNSLLLAAGSGIDSIAAGVLTIGNTTTTGITIGRSGQMAQFPGIASSSQEYVNSSTITGLTFTSASGTNVTVTGYGIFPSLGFTNASGTNLTLTGYLQMLGNNIFDANGNKYVTSTTGMGWSLNAPNVYLTTAANNAGVGATSTLSKFFVQSTSVATTTALFQGMAAQTADLFDVASSSGVNIFQIYNTGVASSTEFRTPSSTIGTLAVTGAGTALTVTGIASSSQEYVNSSTINGLNFTNATGTSLNFTNALGTTLSVTGIASSSQGYVNSSTINGLNFTNATGTSLKYTNASGTNESLTGYLTVASNFRNAAHVNSTGTIPTVGTCGAAPAASFVGTDNAFLVTAGGGTALNTCTVNFATAFNNKPVCTVTVTNTSTPMFIQASSTASVFSFSTWSPTSTVAQNMGQVTFAVMCMGIDG